MHGYDDLPLFVLFLFINRIMYSIYLPDELWIIVSLLCADIWVGTERTAIICIGIFEILREQTL